MARALYRNYRPRRFCEVVGQDAVCTTLKNQIAAGRTGHAYIFTGIRGTGKTTLAKILAKAVNCPNTADGEPCGVCDICRGIDSGAITDVTEIDAASNNGVDNIRDLRDESSYTPVVCSKRVYIIDEVHMLSASAWAAMLKIMEEPPEHVLFILATTEIQKVPATILSRCQRFDLHRITLEGLVGNLMAVSQKEGIDLEPEAAQMIARLADGAMRDALSLLETCASGGQKVTEDLVRTLTGAVDKSYLSELAGAFADGDLSSAIGITDRLYKDSMDPARLAAEFVKYFRNILMAKIGVFGALSEYSDLEKEDFRTLAARFGRHRILELIDIFGKLYDTIGSAPDRRLMLEIAVMKACAVVDSITGGEDQVGIPKRETSTVASEGKVLPVRKAEKGIPKPAVLPEPSDDYPELPAAPEQTSSDIPDGLKPVEGWDRVITAMRSINGLFYGFLIGTKAYISGQHLLIEGSEIFFKFIRENKADVRTLKEVISKELGITLPIGPLKKESAQLSAGPEEEKGLEEFLDLAQKSGIPIEYV